MKMLNTGKGPVVRAPPGLKTRTYSKEMRENGRNRQNLTPPPNHD